MVKTDSPTNGGPGEGRTGRAAPFTGVWVRIGLLFGALGLIKILVLFTYRRNLFENHWRISAFNPGWADPVAFYLFALLVGLNLWLLGTRCAAAGVRAVRVVNLCVLGLGAAFILFTFHAGDKNYLYPLLNGTLTWRNIGWYLAMNGCFGPPYLVAWILAYALVYYLLARTGREHWMLRVTAVCAVIYTVFCLRDLMDNRNALLAIDCVGLASWIAGLAAGRRALPLLWICLPFVGMGFFYALFIPFEQVVLHPEAEFELLSVGSLILFAGMTLLAWRGGGYAAWSWGLPFAFSSFLLLINSNFPVAHNYDHLLTLGLVVPHYFLGEFTAAFLLGAVAIGYRWLLPKDSLWWLDVMNVVLVALALVDWQLSRIMGARLDWQLLEFGDSPTMMWRLARPYLPAFFGLLVVLILGYALAVWWLGKAGARMVEPEKAFVRQGGLFPLLAFLLLGLAGWGIATRDKAEAQTAVHLVDSNPLWRKTVEPLMGREQFFDTAQQLGIRLLAAPATVPASESAPRDVNVVLIFQESSYNRYLSLFDGTDDTEPLCSEYKNRMELFPNFFSDFAGSMWARFATFTGLYPVQDFRKFTDQHVPVKSLFEILHDHNYSCSLFYSSFLDYTDFRSFLRGRGLDAVYDADTMPGPRRFPSVTWGLREEETLAAMQEQIKKYASEHKKFFLTYVPAAPHYPYDAIPDRFRTRRLTQWGDYTPVYLNSLTYQDWIISSVIDQLKESGLLDKTLIVITDDHGEMLGENGGPIGHGWMVTPKLANIPLIIMDPAKPGYTVNHTVGSQVDLLPTILDRLNIPLPGGQIYEGTSLYSVTPNAGRSIYLNSFQHFGVIQNHQLNIGDQNSAATSSSGTSFVITNQGARTIFIQTNAPDSFLPSISRFEEFQENLLANYAYYCRWLQ